MLRIYPNLITRLQKQWLPCILSIFLLLTTPVFSSQHSQAPWESLPATPQLPQPQHSAHISINGIQLWYAIYGEGPPVLLLHGGLANANYWGKIIPKLAKHNTVVVMDSRCHGRSSCNDSPLTYALMGRDVLMLMQHLKLDKVNIIGWSDGANIGIYLATAYPNVIGSVFAFASNSNPTALFDYPKWEAFAAFEARSEEEFLSMGATPEQYKSLKQHLMSLWEHEPNFNKQSLQQIKSKVWIVIADHDEAIKPEDGLFLSQHIKHARLITIKHVGHFALLQDTEQFYSNLSQFLSGNGVV